MIPTFAPVLPTWQRVVTIIFGLGTAAGWGVFAVSSHSAAETERHLREQVASLQAGQLRLLSERDQLQSAATEVAQLRKQLSLAQDETARLTQGRCHVNCYRAHALRQTRSADGLTRQGRLQTSTPPWH
jgi:hypothetical protein